MTWHFAFRWS